MMEQIFIPLHKLYLCERILGYLIYHNAKKSSDILYQTVIKFYLQIFNFAHLAFAHLNTNQGVFSYMVILSVIRQKGQSQSGYFKKTKHAKMFRKTNISYPVLDTETYLCLSGGKKCSFFEKYSVICLFETPVLKFAFLVYYRRYVQLNLGKWNPG